MEPTIIAAVIGAVATVVAAVIALQSGKKAGREEIAREIDDAPRKYVDHLDRLIKRAIQEGGPNAVLNARAIVSTRNDLRESLIKISDRLNSDIDQLAREVGEAAGTDRGNTRQQQAGYSAIYETIQVLSRKWPSKKDQVEVELRKVLAELGLLGRSPSRPAATPPEPEAPEPPRPVASA
jgi:gas vesicle protein